MAALAHRRKRRIQLFDIANLAIDQWRDCSPLQKPSLATQLLVRPTPLGSLYGSCCCQLSRHASVLRQGYPDCITSLNDLWLFISKPD